MSSETGEEAVAAHELRTRLTLDRVLLEVALADAGASAQSLRSTCETLLASNQVHERLLAALLTLAYSERGLKRRYIERQSLGSSRRSRPPLPPATRPCSSA
jgi:hypothetical protein